MSKKYVIIGASAAGIAAMNKLAQLVPDADITCIADQPERAYNKCFLADFLAGSKQEQDIYLHTVLDKHAAIKYISSRVHTIDGAKKQLVCADNTTLPYDVLLLATGSSASIPPFVSYPLPKNVFTYHSLADNHKLISHIKNNTVSHALVIGAGLTGLECADALQKNNIAIILIERNVRLMSQFLDEQASAFLKRKITQTGVQVLCNQTVQGLRTAHDTIEVVLGEGNTISTDIVILATGAKPNVHLAREAGIQVSEHGIMVSETMGTSMHDIYAAGDVIAVNNILTGKQTNSCLWPDAMLQGIHAAHAMAGIPRPYLGSSLIASSSVFNTSFAHAGLLDPETCDDAVLIRQGDDYYHRFIVRKSRLIGFSVLGNCHNLGDLRRSILTGQPFTP